MTKQQASRIRSRAVAGAKEEERKAKQRRAARLHEPYWFGLNMADTINALATDIRRLKRDTPPLNPEHREAITAASIKLAKLLAELPTLLRHPAVEVSTPAALPHTI